MMLRCRALYSVSMLMPDERMSPLDDQPRETEAPSQLSPAVASKTAPPVWPITARPVAARAAPPTEPMATVAARIDRPRWPNALGIVCICFGVLHLFGGICGLASPLWSGVMRSAVPAGEDAWLEISRRWQVWTLPLAGAATVLASMLLAIGIGLLSCRPWSVRLVRMWAPTRILLAIIEAVVQYCVAEETMKAAAAEFARKAASIPPNVAAGATIGAKIGAQIGLVFGLAWGLAFPIFMLIWLSRRTVRSEIATWAQGGEDRAGR